MPRWWACNVISKSTKVSFCICNLSAVSQALWVMVSCEETIYLFSWPQTLLAMLVTWAHLANYRWHSAPKKNLSVYPSLIPDTHRPEFANSSGSWRVLLTVRLIAETWAKTSGRWRHDFKNECRFSVDTREGDFLKVELVCGVLASVHPASLSQTSSCSKPGFLLHFLNLRMFIIRDKKRLCLSLLDLSDYWPCISEPRLLII